MDIAPLKTGLWRQFGATIDYLEDTMLACPDHLWQATLWEHADEPPGFSHFWYRAYHALFWLDVYLFGSEEGFLPPPPFALIEQDEPWQLPDRVYTKDELLGYLRDCRKKCHAAIDALTEENALRLCRFPWGEVPFVELLIFNLRHVQEHTAQLNLLLGQQGVTAPDYRLMARANPK
jgi:uncharacterized damage-inducible protein DinB